MRGTKRNWLSCLVPLPPYAELPSKLEEVTDPNEQHKTLYRAFRNFRKHGLDA